jgi:hypothetical protein
MTNTINSYDILPLVVVLEKLKLKLSEANFLVFLTLNDGDVPFLYNTWEQNTFIKDLTDKITSNKSKGHLFIQEITKIESSERNIYTKNGFLKYKKVSVILIDNNIAYLLRADDVKKGIPENEAGDLIFQNAIELIE